MSIPRRAIARGRGVQTASIYKMDLRGTGPGTPIRVSKTHVVYAESEAIPWLEKQGLTWNGREVVPIGDESRLDSGTVRNGPS